MTVVCPTRVGMNLLPLGEPAWNWGLPHTRGDEPLARQVRDLLLIVCPTRVGMNRPRRRLHRPPKTSAPHAWG